MSNKSKGRETVTSRHPVSNAQVLDGIVARLYGQFYAVNEALFRDDPQRYHAEAHRFVQERLMYFNQENKNDWGLFKWCFYWKYWW